LVDNVQSLTQILFTCTTSLIQYWYHIVTSLVQTDTLILFLAHISSYCNWYSFWWQMCLCMLNLCC